MAAQAHGDPSRSPSTAPRAPSRTSPYGTANALRPRKNTLELPAGHSAEVRPPVNASDFIDKFFAQDSLAFLRWLAQYYWNDLTGLRVVLYLMGSQDVGGVVNLTQAKIAEDLKMAPEVVSRAIKKARRLGLVYNVARGKYQLQPTVTLRGGVVVVDTPVRGAASKKIRVQVEQLSLLNELTCDPNVPEEFRTMAMPDAALPEPPARPLKEAKPLCGQRKKPEE